MVFLKFLITLLLTISTVIAFSLSSSNCGDDTRQSISQEVNEPIRTGIIEIYQGALVQTGIIEIYQGFDGVKVKVNLHGSLELEVFNESGDLVHSSNPTPFKKVNIGTLPSGYYLFKVTIDNNRVEKEVIFIR